MFLNNLLNTFLKLYNCLERNYNHYFKYCKFFKSNKQIAHNATFKKIFGNFLALISDT